MKLRQQKTNSSSHVTRHHISRKAGHFLHADVHHQSYTALLLEFYVPRAIVKAKVVKAFLAELAAIEGATILDGATGVWHGQREKTQIFRLILAQGDNAQQVKTALRGSFGQLLAALALSPRYAQNTLMYTETLVEVNKVENVRYVTT